MTKNNTKLLSTHDMHFNDLIGDMVRAAYDNELMNRRSQFRPKGSSVHKKSPVQNGNAAVACLLLFISFESIVRRVYYFTDGVNKNNAHKKELYWVIRKIKPEVLKDDLFKKTLEELNLIRDIIAHAYIFDGVLEWDAEHKLTSINEKIISGKRIKQAGIARQTALLKLHKAPNQISFSDAAKYYLAVEVLLKTLDLALSHTYWNWSGDDLSPMEWLEKATKKLGYNKSDIWKKLNQKYEDEDYKKFVEGIGELSFE